MTFQALPNTFTSITSKRKSVLAIGQEIQVKYKAGWFRVKMEAMTGSQTSQCIEFFDEFVIQKIKALLDNPASEQPSISLDGEYYKDHHNQFGVSDHVYRTVKVGIQDDHIIFMVQASPDRLVAFTFHRNNFLIQSIFNQEAIQRKAKIRSTIKPFNS